METFDVAIVGGGLIGASVAFELAGRNLRVIVLDRHEPGREASWAAAGMLAPGPEGPDTVSTLPFARESLRLYPEFIAAIEDASGKSTEFMREGSLEVFFGPSGESERDRFVAQHRQFHLAAEAISLEIARQMEPSLSPRAEATAWLPNEATVDPRLLTEATLSAARFRGVTIRPNCGVSGLLREGECCTGIIAGGEKIAARHVVLAAGCFTASMNSEIAGYAPTRPVRGQMVALRASATSSRHSSAAANLRRVLRSANGYLVPRADGRIVAGSTLEDAGFDKTVTAAGVQKIMNAAVELAPSLASAEIVEKWAGLRPGSPDNLPILGPTDIDGLIVATGHYRNGILLAPVTAKLVTAWTTGGQAMPQVDLVSPLRFVHKHTLAAPKKSRQ